MSDLLIDVEPPNAQELGEFLRKVYEEAQIPQPRAVAPCTRYTDRDGKVSCLHSKDNYDKWIVQSGQGFRVTSIQGSYTTSNPDSANTHAKGGVKDIELDGTSYDRCITECKRARDLGLLAYPRFWKGNWHAHVIDVQCPNMAPELAAQVVEFGRGGDGLVGDNPDPLNGYRKTELMALFNRRFIDPPTMPGATVTAQPTTNSLGIYCRPNIQQGLSTVQANAQPKEAGEGTYYFEQRAPGETTWEKLSTRTGKAGVMTRFDYRFSWSREVRCRFVPKNTTAWKASTSQTLTINIVNLDTVSKLAYQVPEVQKALVALTERVAQLEAGNP